MRKILAAPVVLLVTVILAVVCIFVALFSRRMGPTKIMRAWAKIILWLYGVRLVVETEVPLMPDRPAIYMSNHASMIDIPVLVAALPMHFRFIYKKSLSYIPFVGQAMLLMAMVPIDRGNRDRAVRSLRKAGVLIKKGIDLMIFPEGTRTRSGELLPFKKGGFLLAIQEKIDIVPISLSHSQKLAGRSSILASPGTIEVKVHERIDVSNYNLADRSNLVLRVRQKIASGIKK